MSKSGIAKRIGLLASLLVLSALSAAAPVASPPAQSYAPNALHELNSVEQFRLLFQQERGKPRLVLLLSPT